MQMLFKYLRNYSITLNNELLAVVFTLKRNSVGVRRVTQVVNLLTLRKG
ncbi:MAG: hypothetical protein OEV78_09355 [Spirochaetia bacterium]|nr:hypothetical protein [Spirochaetia bacterium]